MTRIILATTRVTFFSGWKGEPRVAVYARSLPSSPLGAISRPPPDLLSRPPITPCSPRRLPSPREKRALETKRATAHGVHPSFHSVASRRLPGGGASVGFPPVSASSATPGAFFLPSPGASEAFGQVLNGVSAFSHARDTSAASSVATPRLCVWGPGLGSTTSRSPSVESVTLGLRLLPSPGPRRCRKPRAKRARRRRGRGAARRGAARGPEAPTRLGPTASTRTRPAFQEMWSAFDRLRRGKRRVGDVERRPGDGERDVTRRTMRLVRRRARWCAGGGEDGRVDSRPFEISA